MMGKAMDRTIPFGIIKTMDDGVEHMIASGQAHTTSFRSRQWRSR
jgi:hypothetical protein